VHVTPVVIVCGWIVTVQLGCVILIACPGVHSKWTVCFVASVVPFAAVNLLVQPFT
jgi:hypothetical protein